MIRQPSVRAAAVACACALALAFAATAAAAPVAPAGFSVTQFAGAPGGATGPDDIARLGSAVVVAYQNGIGPSGEPAPSGATQSDIVLYTPDGVARADWKVTGHVDGLAADPERGRIFASVNEDGNTSLFAIDARFLGAQPVQYAFSPEPDSAHSDGVFTGGGTDGVQVLPDGRLLISASAPNNGLGGPVPNATATFLVTLDRHSHVAHLAPTFADDAQATDALTGETVTIGPPGANPEALTDPDSNALVPWSSPLYAGQYMLDSQGDQLLVFAGFDEGRLALTELPLSREGTPAGVDDVAWATDSQGTLYVVDHGANVVYAVTGPFAAGQSFAGLDSIGSASSTGEVDRLDLASGSMTPFLTGLQVAKGLLYAPGCGEGPWHCGDGPPCGDGRCLMR
jgi:hypothetical protein